MTEQNIDPKTDVRSGLTGDGEPVVFLDAEGKSAMPIDYAEQLGAVLTEAAKLSRLMADVRKWLVDVGCPEEIAKAAALDINKRWSKSQMVEKLMSLPGLFGR